jgi:23S rRNA (cytidine1920-2'-O)/16S rRNA (cytidine1409-2'-O)-methyltransferase
MKLRLDKLLLVRNLTDTRQKAQALIAAGQVYVGGHLADKAGSQFPDDCRIEIKGNDCPYVSRGGYKLAEGLDHFQIAPTRFICADFGASTGGFTDCLLQRGAAKVYAVDVGYGQLAWKLRQDARIVVMERTNARHLVAGDIPEPLDLVVIDASFISLELLIKPALIFLKPSGTILALIKPQFEVGKGQVGKGGVVKDPELHESSIAKIKQFGISAGLICQGVIPSPILGPKGNREFLVHLSRPKAG